ncbi:hypothetical protein V6N13_142689 [Hibiscus sabdariffa]|uniref:Uncharacterized protein n=1 Tax=Hibiscus sabdariffa TaxID=183260 RepID=A0ABR2FEZ5_9ROSI
MRPQAFRRKDTVSQWSSVDNIRQMEAVHCLDKIYKDAMETASQSESGDRELAEELLVYLLIVLELGWINSTIDFTFPYLSQIQNDKISKFRDQCGC